MKWTTVLPVLTGSLSILAPLSAEYVAPILITLTFLSITCSRKHWAFRCSSFLLLLLSSLGILDFSFGLAAANSLLLDKASHAFFLLAPQLNFFVSLETLLADTVLSNYNASWMAPSIAFILLLPLIASVRCLMFAAPASLVIVLIINTLPSSSSLKMAIIAPILSIIACWCFSSLVSLSQQTEDKANIGRARITYITCAIIFLISIFHITPRSTDGIYWLIHSKNQYNSSTQEALTALEAEISTIRINDLSNIPKKSTLIISDLGLSDAYNQNDLLEIKNIAQTKSLNVILFAEHTNAQQVADHINSLVGQEIVNNDLLVPYENRDTNGLTRGSGLRMWPADALINRGASLRVSSVSDLVLVRGDGWWSEANLGDWLWLGDYVEQSQDNGGRKSLIVTLDEEARWTIVADSSMAIDKMFVHDPQPVRELIKASLGWPSFCKDFFTLLLISFSSSCGAPIVAALILVFMLLTAQGELTPSWRLSRETPFSSSSFNSALVNTPELLQYSIQFQRFEKAQLNVSPIHKTVYFMHVEENSFFDDIKLTECRRMGNLHLPNNLTLMNAQACSLRGSADTVTIPLIGSMEECAAFLHKSKNGSWSLVILDPHFISQNAPVTNSQWLLKQLHSLNSK